MDIRFLESFVHVVELGSIAEAARALHLTPTAISMRIKALEDQVHARLIERVGRTVMPTESGMKILAQAKLILAEIDVLHSLASDDALPAGPLTLGAIPSVMNGKLPGMLRKWMQKHRDVQILIEPAASTILYQRVIQNQLDAAILTQPLFDLPKTCDWQLLWTDTIILLTPASTVPKEPFDMIRENPFIRYDRRVVGGKMVDDYLKMHGIIPRTILELDGINHIADLVKSGLGVAILPSSAAQGPDDPAIRRYTLPAPTPTRSIGLLWLRSTARKGLVQEFRKIAL